MTDSIKKLSVNSLAWEIILIDIRGFVVSKFGYVFVAGYYDETWSLVKYSPLGIFISSTALGFEPNDIFLGYDNDIYICGEGGYLGKYTDELVVSFSDSVDGSPSLSQIEVDKQGFVYVFYEALGTPGKISKYQLSDVSGKALLWWTMDDYVVSGATWGSYKDPSYWTLDSEQMTWDGTDYVYVGNIYNNASLTVPVGATWQDGISPEPTQLRVSFSGTATIKRISFYAGTPGSSGVLVSKIDYPTSSPVILDCLDIWFTTFEPYSIGFSVDGGGTDDLKITGIEFGSPAAEVAGITKIIISEDSNLYAVGELAGETYSLLCVDTDSGEVKSETFRGYPIELLTFQDNNTLIISEELLAGDRITSLDLEEGTDSWGYTPTGMDVSSFSEGIYGALKLSTMAAKMSFSSKEITIDGTEVQHILPEAKMLFSQPPAEIEGYKRIVIIDPAKMDFSSTSFPSITIGATNPASMAFSSDPIVFAPSIVSPSPKMLFYQPPAEIAGHKRIVTIPPGALSFTGPVPSLVSLSLTTGSWALNVPASMTFSSNIFIDKKIVFVKAPVMGFSSVAYPKNEEVGIDCTLPVFTMEAFDGDNISGELPTINAEIIAFAELLADIKATLPPIGLSMSGGMDHITADLPGMEMTGEASSGTLSTLDNTVGAIEATIPMLKCRMEALRGDNFIFIQFSEIFDSMELTATSDSPAFGTPETDIDCDGFYSGVLRNIRGQIR